MDKMTELYDILCDELEKITEKGELTAGSLDAVDKIVDIMKDMEDMGYSGMGRSYDMYNRSYARRRDSMGRYSRDEFKDRLEDVMRSAPNEKTRKELERLMMRM